MADKLSNFEPSEKRLRRRPEKRQNEQETNDVLAILPPEIVNKIFLLLDNFDIFRTIALVCKRWNRYVNSEQFWRALIAFEFGKEAERQFLLSCQGDSLLMTDKMRQILSFDYECCDYEATCQAFTLEDLYYHADGGRRWYTSVDNFLRDIRAERKNLESKEIYSKHGFRLLNLAKIVPHPETVLENLQLQFAIRAPCTSAHPGLFYFVDSQLNLIETFGTSCCLWSLISLKSSVWYLAFRETEFRLRLLLPSAGTRITCLKKSDTFRLIKLAGNGDALKIAESLSETHPDIEGLGSERPLVEAAKNGHIQAVQVLLKAGAKLERPDNECFTPLGAAAANGRNECLCFLLGSGAKINSTKGIPALLCAIMMAKVRTIKLLIDLGANVQIEDRAGRNALHYLAHYFRDNYFEKGFEHLKDPLEKEARISAFERDLLTVLDWLVERGCDVNAISGFEKMTPLMIGCQHHDLKLAMWLIDRGADVSIQTEGREPTPLLAAVDLKPKDKGARLKLVKLLLNKGAGATMEVRNGIYQTALESLLDYGLEDESNSCDHSLLKLLIEHGANVNVEQSSLEGRPVEGGLLVRGLSWHLAEAAKLLVSAGANVNVADQFGVSPLMYAARMNDPELVDMLIEHGAEVNARDQQGRTALIYAAKASVDETEFKHRLYEKNPSDQSKVCACVYAIVIGALLRHGADPNLKDDSNRIPLDYINRKAMNICRVFALLKYGL